MQPQELIELNPTNAFITGEAGSGKTYLIQKTIELKLRFGLLTATTGVAARVLGDGVKTIQSTLHFFDEQSLYNSYTKGSLRKNLLVIKKKYDRLIIDEVSMLSPYVLECLSIACTEVGLGLILVGDFLQLPPVDTSKKEKDPTKWVFNTCAWNKFNGHVIRLTTQFRQHGDFLTAVNLLRRGRGGEAIPYLLKAGVTFRPVGARDPNFGGTTIVATNSARNVINSAMYASLDPDTEMTFTTERAGHGHLKAYAKKYKPYVSQYKPVPSEWNDIPDAVTFRIGTRVMILRNLYEDNNAHNLLQSNGDTGTVVEMESDRVIVERDDHQLVEVRMLVANNGSSHGEIDEHGKRVLILDEPPTATITYMPLTVAWALTVHKSQGLTINQPTQIVMEEFFKSPAMVYVAVSRVVNPKDLTIVGGCMGAKHAFSDEVTEVYPEPRLKTLCHYDPQCTKWL
jgi:hypothetical protein